MKKRFLCHAVLGAAMAFAACSQSNHETTIERKSVDGLPTVTETANVAATATVEAIDYDSRSIALAGSDGKTEFFQATPAVRNFNQIKKGDTVQVQYVSRLHVSLQKTPQEPVTTVAEAVSLADLGEKPGGVLYRYAQTQATVLSIDYATRVVTMRSMTGSRITLTVDKKLADFDKVKVGDTVLFNYTEALTIDVK